MGKARHEALTVRPGQVWADNDPRHAGRTFRIERSTGAGKAECKVLTHARERQNPKGRGKSTTVSISLHRFKERRNGYTLVSEPSVIGKSAEQRTRELAEMLGIFSDESVYGSILRAFKEHARDQRHLCAEAVPHLGKASEVVTDPVEAHAQALSAAHMAVFNAPEPGMHHG